MSKPQLLPINKKNTGTAVFPKLDKVDVYQPVDPRTKQPKGDPKRTYNTQIKFSDEDHREVDAWLKKLAKDAGLSSVTHWPWKKDKKTGEVSLRVESGEKYKPTLFDASNNALPPEVVIGGGSQIRVYVIPYIYDGLGGGIKLRLKSVQVVKLEAGGGASPFDEDPDGYVAPKAAASPFNADEVEHDEEDEEAF